MTPEAVLWTFVAGVIVWVVLSWLGRRSRRRSFKPMVLTDSRSVHIHYFTDDETLERQGWGMADLVCHGCGRARRLVYPNPTEEQLRAQAMKPIRDAFVDAHAGCWAPLHVSACPAYAEPLAEVVP